MLPGIETLVRKIPDKAARPLLALYWRAPGNVSQHTARLTAAPSRAASRVRGRLRRASEGKGSHDLADWAADCSLDIEEQKKMPLINLVIALIVVGVALYLVNRFIPMASSIKTILNVVVVVAVCVWLLQAVGLWGNVSSYRLTR